MGEIWIKSKCALQTRNYGQSCYTHTFILSWKGWNSVLGCRRHILYSCWLRVLEINGASPVNTHNFYLCRRSLRKPVDIQGVDKGLVYILIAHSIYVPVLQEWEVFTFIIPNSLHSRANTFLCICKTRSISPSLKTLQQICRQIFTKICAFNVLYCTALTTVLEC